MLSLGSLAVAARTSGAALRANPVRALLATLGVVIGSAALVAVLAVSDGVEEYARIRVARQGFDRIVIRPIVHDTVDGQYVPRLSVASLGLSELESARAVLVPGERLVLSRGALGLAQLPQSGRARAVQLRGVAYTETDNFGDSVAAGRLLTPAEAATGADVAVVNSALARAIAGDSAAPVTSAIGDSLQLGARWLRVVGVTASLSDSPGERRGVLMAIVPMSVFESAPVAGGSSRSAPYMSVLTSRAEDVLPMRQRMEGWLATTDPRWTSNYQIQARTQEQLDEVRKGMLIFRLLMGSITGITLIVGGIGIMNVLLASVAERTREIGVRKAVGAKRGDILLQFLAESVTITGVGSAIGTAVGLAGAYGVTAIMRAQTEALIHAATTGQTLLISAALAVIVGIAFGTYPAMRAARLAPIDAIHTE
ncbi:MAG TPA: ABC transporter permease [Gemmatimonadaceae bacterium]|nr:ABC transporter permease [Gemmatimonadaceae bacterium]